jgi:hypothetical protein
MAVQTTYNQPAYGVPGMFYDAANRNVVVRAARCGDGTIQFGAGVMRGDKPGKNVTSNDGSGTAETFEGVVAYGVSMERQYPGGGTSILDGTNLNVLQQGRIWVQLAEGEDPAYGDAVFWQEDGTFSTETGVQLNAKFIGEATADGIAPAEFYGGAIKEVEGNG